MLKKLHWRLTAICTAITSIIILLMTIFSISLSEKGLVQKEYASFLNYVNNIYSHLDLETTITMEWVRSTEKNGAYLLSIEDNGNPIEIIENKNSFNQSLIQKTKTIAASAYDLNLYSLKPSQVLSKHVEFTLSERGKDYYVSAGYIPKDNGAVSAVIIYPLETFYHSIIIQRGISAAAALLAIFSLFIFSYFFTKKAIKPVEESQTKQVQFIAAASHELRSPLTVIRSSLSAIKKADADRARRFEIIIDQEIDRMSRLLKDMLLLAGTGEQSWSLTHEEVDILFLLKDVYDSFQQITAEKKLELTLLMPETDITVTCDKQRIEQVLYILLNNASSYTPEGGTITLSCRVKGRKCILTVSDTGPGIPDEYKQQIFERFYRIDSSHKNKEHFGLGLCIAMEIMKLHKGTIEVTDAPRGGAAFHLTLNI
ncbi:MAG: HAMP domain-containing sensor histidine kinase [Anaerocolumna sp.]